MTTAFYTHPDCLLHEMGAWHPESPTRLQAIQDQLVASRINTRLQYRQAPYADVAAIARIHTPAAIALIRDNIPQALGGQSCYYPLDGDTSLNAFSWKAALAAAGAAVAATDAVINGEVDNAFCAIRPPGHHACPTEPMGFCLFNNIAIAARHALEVHGLERVAIIDFDVHHGNGTEEAFANQAGVLLVGFFQHPFYPYSGIDPGIANAVSLPFPAGTAGAAVRKSITEKWLPALHAYRPQMIFISAGFDAHRDDGIGQMALLEDDFAWITRQIMQIAKLYAGGRIVSCLEGGYNLSALGSSVAAHLDVMSALE